MPHKHKRKRDDLEKSHFDLPPSTKARPLPTQKPKPQIETLDLPKSKRRRRLDRRKQNSGKMTDDTPKQFARLMAFQNDGKRLPKSLDDGNEKSLRKTKDKNKQNRTQNRNQDRDQKQKQQTQAAAHPSTTTSTDNTTTTPPAPPTLTILPHERLSDFSRRVDQTLPLASHLPKTHTPKSSLPPGVKPHHTKHDRKLLRLQSAWRETDRELRERAAERMEELEDRREEEGLLWMDVDAERGNRKGKKKRVGVDAGADADPWKALERKRADVRQRGLQDVVVAPPVLKPVKNMFREVRERPAVVNAVGLGSIRNE